MYAHDFIAVLAPWKKDGVTKRDKIKLKLAGNMLAGRDQSWPKLARTTSDDSSSPMTVCEMAFSFIMLGHSPKFGVKHVI